MHINLAMTISFRQMRLFLALADTGSVTAAARACHVTQPTASMQLREITDTVGVPRAPHRRRPRPCPNCPIDL
jgi:DNA-binding transcriptional LysR family regulator